MAEMEIMEAFSKTLESNNKMLLNEIRNTIEPIKTNIDDIQIKVNNIEAKMEKMQNDLSEVKDRILRVEVTLENDIPKRLDSLYEGYRGNHELIEELKIMEQETNSMVSALDIAKFIQSGNGQNLKIVK